MREKNPFFTNKEKILWSLVENYRYVINVTQINLTREDWGKISNIYNIHRDVTTCTKKQQQLARMWSQIIRRYLFVLKQCSKNNYYYFFNILRRKLFRKYPNLLTQDDNTYSFAPTEVVDNYDLQYNNTAKPQLNDTVKSEPSEEVCIGEKIYLN